MKVYTIACAEHKCYGHGDFGTEYVIRASGPYGTGEFPPVFEQKSQAEAYICQDACKLFGVLRVVELELVKGGDTP